MKKYSDYLPAILKEIEEFKAIGGAEDKVIGEEEKAFKEIEASQWIETSGEEGILKREKLLGIKSSMYDTIEDRRNIVSARWKSCYPYTYYSLKKWLENVYGSENFMLTVNSDRYEVLITIRLSIKYMLEEIFNWARRIIPANMMLIVTLKYARHRDILKKYGELKAFSHKAIREDVFDVALNG